MIGKKGRIRFWSIAVIVISIVIIGGLIFVFRGDKNLCEEIDDEGLLIECNECEGAYDSVDCRDMIYIKFAELKKDVSLCKNLILEYNLDDCKKNVGLRISRRESVEIERGI